MNRVWSITQLNRYLSGLIETDAAFVLPIVVEGEIVTEARKHQDNKPYRLFTLVDSVNSNGNPSKGMQQLACYVTMYSVGKADWQAAREAEGRVRVTGRLIIKGEYSKYQLNVTRIESMAEGLLTAQKQALIDELRKKGYFDPENKKPIPKYITKVGVVTSAGGQAIQDICSDIQSRNPHVQVLLVPSNVQGKYAAQTLANGLRVLDQFGMDVIILARGGGGNLDLSAFDSREVADAIFDCVTPVITAIGHTGNRSIADETADLAVITPTQAADTVFDFTVFEDCLLKYRQQLDSFMRGKISSYELAVSKSRRQIEKGSPKMWLEKADNRLKQLIEVIRHAFMEKLSTKQNQVSGYAPMLRNAMRVKTDAATHRLELTADRLPDMMQQKIRDREGKLKLAVQKIDYSSPLRKISDGFAYVEGEHGRITSITQVEENDPMRVRLSDGIIESTVTGTMEEKIGSRK